MPDRNDFHPGCRLAIMDGSYVFRLDEGCFLDAEEFERYIRQAGELKDTRPAQAMDLYRKALSLYRGEYLPQNLYHEWAIPARIYYHRLYRQALHDQLQLLRAEDDHRAIARICEESLRIDPYEEAVQVYYLESLLELGRLKQAEAWYEYITAKLGKEFGVRPLPALKGIYQKINSAASRNPSE